MAEISVFRTIGQQIADRIGAEVISGRLAEGTSLREQAVANWTAPLFIEKAVIYCFN